MNKQQQKGKLETQRDRPLNVCWWHMLFSCVTIEGIQGRTDRDHGGSELSSKTSSLLALLFPSWWGLLGRGDKHKELLLDFSHLLLLGGISHWSFGYHPCIKAYLSQGPGTAAPLRRLVIAQIKHCLDTGHWAWRHTHFVSRHATVHLLPGLKPIPVPSLSIPILGQVPEPLSALDNQT